MTAEIGMEKQRRMERNLRSTTFHGAIVILHIHSTIRLTGQAARIGAFMVARGERVVNTGSKVICTLVQEQGLVG